MLSKFKYDYYRIHGEFLRASKIWIHLLAQPRLLFLFLNRLAEGNSLTCKVLKVITKIYGRKYGLEFQTNNIGIGFSIGHPFCITINSQAIIGINCSVSKGVTIGQAIKKGSDTRNFVPRLGDSVWIGANATLVGNIVIGDDVLIAPNAYVNFDIPDHSVVIGNPGIIHSKLNATELYITNKINRGE